VNNIEKIIWDWNGTLLNDVEICIESINVLLDQRGIPVLNKERYRNIFTFPVMDYYREAGFDFENESFDSMAHEFIDVYKEKILNCTVFPQAGSVLEAFTKKEYHQYMISAMQHDFLVESVRQNGIIHHFKALSGITDHYANGKVTMARKFIREKSIDPDKAVFVGDTLHDAEVAEELGMRCILVANGHQSYERLLETGCNVVHELAEVLDCVEKNCLENPIDIKNG